MTLDDPDRPPEWEWRPDLDPANAEVPEWVYLVHLDRPIGDRDNPRGQAQHYFGSTEDLEERMGRHRAGRGSPLLRAAAEADDDFHIVRTWPGGRTLERTFHDAQNSPRFCPECSASPRMSLPKVTPRRVRIAARKAAEAAKRAAARATGKTPQPAPPAREPPPSPQARGRQNAERFLAERDGWPSDQLQASLEYVMRPYRERGPRTAGQDAAMAAFVDHVQGAIDDLRSGEQAMRPSDEPEPAQQAAPADEREPPEWLPEEFRQKREPDPRPAEPPEPDPKAQAA